MTPTDKVLLVPGAGGKLGRLLRRYWTMSPPKGWRILWMSRRADADVSWPVDSPPSCDAILALWGVTPGGADMSANVSLASDAMDLARRCGARRVLHCSSSAVYGVGRDMSEETPTDPATEYGKAKVQMEQWVRAHPVPGVESCLMRMANVVGAESLFAAIGREGALQLDRFPNGQGPRRSYLSVSRFAESVLALLETDMLPEVVNVAGLEPVAMADLVRAAGKEMTWQDAPDTALPVVALNTGRLETILGETEPETAEKMIAEWRSLGGVPA